MPGFYIPSVAAMRLSKSVITILFGINLRTEPTHSLRNGLHGRVVGCASSCRVNDSPRFDSESVVYSHSQTLPAANVAFSGLNRDMHEKKLDLLKLTSRMVAEPRTRPSQP